MELILLRVVAVGSSCSLLGSPCLTALARFCSLRRYCCFTCVSRAQLLLCCLSSLPAIPFILFHYQDRIFRPTSTVGAIADAWEHNGGRRLKAQRTSPRLPLSRRREASLRPGPAPLCLRPWGWRCWAAGRPFPCAASRRAPARRGDVSTGGGCGWAEPGAVAGAVPAAGCSEGWAERGPGGGLLDFGARQREGRSREACTWRRARAAAASRSVLPAPAVRAVPVTGRRA